MRKLFLVLSLLIAAFVASETIASAQGSPPENPNRRRFRAVTGASVSNPPTGFADVFFDSGTQLFYWKLPDGTVTEFANTAGAGTVASVDLALPNIFSVSGGPITTSGTITATLASQTQHFVFSAP